MDDNEYIILPNSISYLGYHIVCPSKHGLVDFNKTIEEYFKQICFSIELRYSYIDFLEIGIDSHCIHFVIQSTPDYAPSEIVEIIKRITAKRLFDEFPSLKKQLWEGDLYNDDSYISSVDLSLNRNIIEEYMCEYGEEYKSYKRLYLK